MVRKSLFLSTALVAISALSAAIDAAPASAAMRVTLPTVELSPLQLAAYDAQVYRAQVALSNRGYDVGAPDGKYGPRTRSAIEAFQREKGLSVNGQVSQSLVAQLESDRPARADRSVDRDRGRQMSESQLISTTQSELKRHGYDITYVGGRLNGETRDAIADYQRRHNLEPTGLPSPELLAMIRSDRDRVSDRSWRNRDNDWRDNASTARDRSNSAPARYVTRVTDDFGDGDFTANPTWRQLSGQWTVQNGVLTSSVPVRVGQNQQQQQLPQIIGQVFEQRLGLSGSGQEHAAIATTRAIDNAFRISINLGARGQAPGTINFGPYVGTDAGGGYRLVYDGESSRPLKLMASGQGGLQTVATASSNANLFDGRMHAIEWTRDANGRTSVSIDGVPALEARDTSIASDFDGFSIVNTGGSWGIDSVTVQNATR